MVTATPTKTGPVAPAIQTGHHQPENLRTRLQAQLPFSISTVLAPNTLVLDGPELANWQALTRAFWTLLQEDEE